MRKHVAFLFFVLAFIVLPSRSVPADEGMWLLNKLPIAELQQKYGFVPSQQWVEHVQKAAVRFAVDDPNCSSSFESAKGLVSTNWHCVASALKAVSTPERDIYKMAYVGHSLSDDLPLPGVYLQQFVSAEDITDDVRQEYSSITSRGGTVSVDAILRMLTTSARQKSGLYCESVIFGGGAEYQIYCYKEFRDVRLVFAPEESVGFFGGDPDNFTFPRFNLDQVFVRAYEDNKPAEIQYYLSWSETGPEPGELLFVAGYPGSTQRRYTMAATKIERDVFVPFILETLRWQEQTLLKFAKGSEEHSSISTSDLFSVQNSRKAYEGKLATITDPRFMAAKEKFEKDLLTDADAKDSAIAMLLREGIQIVADSQDDKLRERIRLGLVSSWGFDTSLRDLAFGVATNGFRRDQFGNIRYYDPFRGIYYLWTNTDIEAVSLTDLERSYESAKLERSLRFLIEKLGYGDNLVRNILYKESDNGVALFNSVENIARSAIEDSVLTNPKKLKNMRDGKFESPVNAYQTDPMIKIAVLLLTDYFDALSAYRVALDNERLGYAKIEQVVTMLRGDARYPDATFTLRLAYGTMQAINDNGVQTSAVTTIGGAFLHAEAHNREEPWQLSDRWFDNRGNVDLTMPLNFITNIDITGGNSGSPVFTRDFRHVGTMFDSNLPALSTDYDYNFDPLSRSIAVHSAGVIEALRNIYGARELVDELLGKGFMQ